MHWNYKVILQRMCSHTPYGEHLDDLIQKKFGSFKDFSILNKLSPFKTLSSSLMEIDFSVKEWEKYNNKFIYQNRLPASQYRSIIEDCAFEIIKWEPQVSKLKSVEASQLNIDQQDKKYTLKDLATTSLCVVAKPLSG